MTRRELRICAHCGDVFEIGSGKRKRTAIFCSDACKKDAQSIRNIIKRTVKRLSKD